VCLLPQLPPLSGISSLQQLDISCNLISSLAPLSGLTALTHLSCEGNSISSLVGMSSLDSLVELYAAHNSLADIKVGFLKAFRKKGWPLLLSTAHQGHC
jgi:Leucine-rich repeat (LRR) protein